MCSCDGENHSQISCWAHMVILCLGMLANVWLSNKVVRKQEKRNYKRNSPSVHLSLPPIGGEHVAFSPWDLLELLLEWVFPFQGNVSESHCSFLSSPCADTSRHHSVASPAQSCYETEAGIEAHFTASSAHDFSSPLNWMNAHEWMTRFRMCSLCQTTCELQPASWRQLGHKMSL